MSKHQEGEEGLGKAGRYPAKGGGRHLCVEYVILSGVIGGATVGVIVVDHVIGND